MPNGRVPTVRVLLIVALLVGALGTGALSCLGPDDRRETVPSGTPGEKGSDDVPRSATPSAAQKRPGPAEQATRKRPGDLDVRAGTDEERARHEAWIRQTIAGMTLEEKVGQLFVTQVYGADPNAPDSRNTSAYGVATPAEVVAKYHLGGVAYFTWSDNVESPRQLAGLSNGLQRAATSSGAQLPLLISTDQEHGEITRIGPPATQFPGAMALGASRNRGDAYEAAVIAGRELVALGVNQNYAPVADVNVNPANPVIGVRSFGADPRRVSGLTSAQVEGFETEAGIAATAKHFPGHGDTTVDSHTGIPVITHSREEWERIDAPPFEAAIAAGVDAIMTGHLAVPALDPSGDPATLSRPILTGVLREELGYDGVVITDALLMDGVRDAYGDDRVPVLALQAGADLLLQPPDLPLAYDAVLAAVRSGEISKARLHESLTRILRLKVRNGIVADPYVNVERVPSRVGTDEHMAAAGAITRRTTTLVRDDAGLVPLPPTAEDVLVTGDGETATGTVAGRLTALGTPTTAYATGSSPGKAEIAEATAQARESDVAVVLTRRAWDDENAAQRSLVGALRRSGTPVVVVATAEPHDLAHLPGAETYLAAYASNPVAMRALADVLSGEVRPRGRLPVPITE